jgi:cytochrome c oxidase subunit 2
LIKRAVTQGIGADGRKLDLIMPRWQMSDTDLNDLIAYLKTMP